MDFSVQAAKFFERLSEYPYMVLATCADDRPLACTMTCLVYDDAIWMQTDSTFLKCEQMQRNPRVALCANSIQIEGTVTFCGHPLAPENAKFAARLGERFPDMLERYAQVPTQVVLCISPLLATDWLYEAGAEEIIHLDFEKKAVEIERYETDADESK